MDFKLPNDISGSYSFDPADDLDKLINVDSQDNEWVLYSTDVSKIMDGKSVCVSKILEPMHFYVLKRYDREYLIYVSDLKIPSINCYAYNSSVDIILANNAEANIIYNCPYIQTDSVHIFIKDKQLTLERLGDIKVYLNKDIVRAKTQVICFGDEVEIYGLRIKFLNGLMLVNNLADLLTIRPMVGFGKYLLPAQEKEQDIAVKDVDLYKKSDYFSKSPRMRRVIETKKIKLSSPPNSQSNQDLPLILIIGPMLTMGATSAITLLSTVSKINSGETTMKQSWVSLLTSGIMLISTLLWPLITQFYNRIVRKKKLRDTVKKYNDYLNTKREELTKEAQVQKAILNENLLTVNDCLDIIARRSVLFWGKRIDQSDFLNVRIGRGNELLDVEVEYPEQEFTIEESEIKKKADNMVEDFKYIKDVPIGYSFNDNRITAIMGNERKILNFTNNILLQLLTYYSYEDIKLVVFTNEKNAYNWEYIKYLNHNFNNERDFRFFAADPNSRKQVAEYLNYEVNNRIAMKERMKDPFKPHYIVIVDDYETIKRTDFVKTLTETEDNIGFSLIILENRLSKLPSKCNNFIAIGEKTSGILKNAYEKQEQVNFQEEISYGVNMMQVAKVLANIPIEFEDGLAQLPDAISFLEMEKVGKIEQLNILNRWNMNDSCTSLAAEVGVDEQGNLMYLDLHEKYHGPHGLIAGMTGSGKSEFIITYILSMAINFSPDDIAFILIDYKGGGLAFAFENKANNIILPHLAGTITNLDKAEMDRTLVSIDSEIKRRQRIFNEARDAMGESTIDIYKYQRFYHDGKLDIPIPHLFIICDEFAELKSQQPDFMDNLISVARIGRSLGVHLILATQKPSGVVNDQIWSNTKFRVCLKVQDASDSKEMLKRPEAASLKQTGRFYLQVGYDEYFALGQSGWCGAKYYPSEKLVKQVDKSINFIDDSCNFIKSIQASKNIKITPQGEQLAAIMGEIINVANKVSKKARRLWLDNIPEVITTDDIYEKYNIKDNNLDISALLGEYDAPERQEQGPVVYNYLNDGNTMIYGNDGSESEMLLSTMIYSTTKNHSSEEINYYIVDYGSESLGKFNKLPHVGGVVYASDEEKYNNLFKLLKEELKSRKKLFSDYGGEYLNYMKSTKKQLPVIVVILNNYDSIYENDQGIYEVLPDLMRDSERYGIVFVVTANAVNSVPSKITQNSHNTYAFKLKDANDYTTIFGVRTKSVPRDIFGRGMLNNDGIHEFQVTSLTIDDDVNGFISEFIDQQIEKNKAVAKKIPTLPEIVRFDDVREQFLGLQSVPVGISKKDLEVCTFDYSSNVGSIICSNKIINTSIFVKSLLGMFRAIDGLNLIIIDPLKQLQLDTNQFKNYYTQNFDQLIDSLNDALDQFINSKSNSQGMIVIYGINKFLSKLQDKAKFDSLAQKLKTYEKFNIIIVDDAAKIKSFAYDSWFTSVFTVNDGIWIGRGISDQGLLHLSTVSKEMMKEYKNDMGYLVNDGQATLIKLNDFISKDGDENGK